MSRHTLIAPTIPTQAEIDRAVGRGRRMRSTAVLSAISSLFGAHEGTRRT